MGVIDRFGSYVCRSEQKNPARAWSLLMAAWKGFGLYQKHFPDRKLPESRQYVADFCNVFFTQALSHPETSILCSLFMPAELVQAFHLHPICAEMFSTFTAGAGSEQGLIQAAEEHGVSSTFCSYHKILTGAALSGVLPRPAAILNTSLACDANNLTFRTLAKYYGISQYYVDVPYAKNDASVDYVAEQLRDAKEALERSGFRFDEAEFERVIARSRETIDLLNEVCTYRRDRYLPNTLTSELYEGLMCHTALGSEGALTFAKKLKADYEKAPVDHGIRLLWLHTNPFWQQAAKDLLNENEKVHVVCTEIGYDNWRICQRRDPYEYMAERVVYNPFNGPVDDRIAMAREMAELMHCDGAVLFCHWGCKETCGGAELFKQRMEESGIPLLILNGDGVDRHNASSGQTSTRLGAFVEMLEERK
jgi:benzoyl-CoA reductase/2-hydroxyglutaryl-CoA dehydratase subunit BcrC/BadD/HgdB